MELAPAHPGHAPLQVRDYAWLPAFLLLAGVPAVLGSLATLPAIPGWYQALEKPEWTPPSWLFGPVWTILYLFMGIASWRIWVRDGRWALSQPLEWYGAQLLLNAAWSLVFFGAHNVGGALVVILALDVAVAGTTWRFARLDRASAWLMGPYLAWILFATALNAAIWMLN